MLKRLAARGKTPPGPVSPPVTSKGEDKFDLGQTSDEAAASSPVSPSSVFFVTVYTLDDDQSPLEISVQKDSDGQWLFDEACEQLGGVQERDYFGLRFLDRDKQRQWVDVTRNIYRQLKHMNPCCVSFRVKHYPPNPLEDFKQEISKYFLFMQVKRDILHSRLLCQGSDAYELAAYIVQSELGDYEDVEDPETYLTDLKLLPNQSPKSESKIAEMHKSLKGLVPSEAEAQFLVAAAKMETYGIDPYSVKDQKGNVLYLGLTHLGVVTFQGSRRAHVFKWLDITKFNYDGKLFIIHVTFREDNQFKRKTWLNRITKKHILGFKCESNAAALSLWRWAVDRYCFFTLKRSSEAKRAKSGGGVFRRSHTFRFSGRCQREALSNSQSLLTLPQPAFARASSFRREERLVQPLLIDDSDKFATFPRTRKQKDEEQVLPAPLDEPPAAGIPASQTGPELSAVSEREEKEDSRQDSGIDAGPPSDQPDTASADGEVVESIVVPTLSDRQEAAPPASFQEERAVDVEEERGAPAADGGEDPSLTAHVPVDGGRPQKPSPEAVGNHVGDAAVAKDGRAGVGACVSRLLLALVLGVAAMLLLLEVGPRWALWDQLTDSGPARLVEAWRQAWYLPLRSKIVAAST